MIFTLENCDKRFTSNLKIKYISVIQLELIFMRRKMSESPYLMVKHMWLEFYLAVEVCLASLRAGLDDKTD